LLAKHLLASLLLCATAWGEPVERKVTFMIEPKNAEVLIPNHTGGFDRYRSQSEVWLKFPSAAFDLKIEAPGWKPQNIPVNANQFQDRWPVTGSLQLEPDSVMARLQVLPKWPILLLGLPAGFFWRRKLQPPAAEVVAPSPTGLPWELMPGAKIGQYQVLQRLGEGVSAVVYRVAAPDGELALKLLKPQSFRGTDVLPRFRREMKSLCRLRHPNIPFLDDFGEYMEMNYLAMELLSPRSLLDSLANGPLNSAETMVVLKQLCEALIFCHRQGILHRDIKPENVVWGQDGTIRLTDFGLARPHDATTLTIEGTLLGTPSYMAPELVQGQPANEQSDQYSLGCLAYHMLSGAPPFSGETALAVLMQHITTEAPALEGVDPKLEAWVRRTMAKSADERFASVAEALTALKGIG
jgi:tRNA A-37 threonylcarbamoyl transferase component Bud32